MSTAALAIEVWAEVLVAWMVVIGLWLIVESQHTQFIRGVKLKLSNSDQSQITFRFSVFRRCCTASISSMELHMPPLRPPPYTATIPAHHTEHHCLLSPRHFTTRRDTPNNMHTLFNSSRGSMCSPSRVSSTPQQPSTSRRRANIAAAAAAGRSSGGATISLKRFADAADAAAAVVTERRAADVAVLGSSTAAVLAAYTLAKSGRKVGSLAVGCSKD